MKYIILISFLALLVGMLSACYSPKFDSPPTYMVGDKWKAMIEQMPMSIDLPIKTDFRTLSEVKEYVETFEYQLDKDVYDVSDYWATPAEFLYNHGGDCEDFAIFSYYVILKSGLATEDEMDMVLVYDKDTNNTPHMVLRVRDVIFDNQQKGVKSINCYCVERYKPIAVMNRSR